MLFVTIHTCECREPAVALSSPQLSKHLHTPYILVVHVLAATCTVEVAVRWRVLALTFNIVYPTSSMRIRKSNLDEDMYPIFSYSIKIPP